MIEKVTIGSMAGGATLKVKVTPRARTSGVEGLHGDALKVKLKAPPVDGKANEELERYFAELLGLKRDQVQVALGLTSRAKTLRFPDLTPDRLKNLLSRALASREPKSYDRSAQDEQP